MSEALIQTDDPSREPTLAEECAMLGEEDLFEMVNLREQDTGVSGVLFVSTAVGAHGPRVKFFLNVGRDQPSFSVSIGPEPRVLANSLPERELRRAAPAVIALGPGEPCCAAALLESPRRDGRARVGGVRGGAGAGVKRACPNIGAEAKTNHEGTKGAKVDARVEAVASEVVDAGLKVHRSLGPGLLESTYEHCLARELGIRGLLVRRQAALPIVYEGEKLEAGYRLDLVVEGCVIVEVKAVQALAPIHEAQLLTYLRLSGIRLGFLMNFHVVLFKQGVKRMVL